MAASALEALIAFLTRVGRNVDPDEIEETGEGPYGYGVEYNVNGTEVYVMTDNEAHSATRECIESYVDDVVLPQIPKELRRYFDTEPFIEDAMGDGYGHYLNSYDFGMEEVGDYCIFVLGTL